MLKAERLKKSYGALQVLKGVDVNVAKGEVVVIVGASGAGKSSLLHILGTLDSPDAGKVIIRDTEVSGQSSARLAQFRNTHIGFVFQTFNLLAGFTALENVLLGMTFKNPAHKKVLEMEGIRQWVVPREEGYAAMMAALDMGFGAEGALVRPAAPSAR